MTTTLDKPSHRSDSSSVFPARSSSLFRSYWIGSYAAADHMNGSVYPLTFNQLSRHWERLEEDYAGLAPLGIMSVRESVAWRLIERGGAFDWRQLEKQARVANRHGIQVLWALMHFGWPNDIDPFTPQFVDRFARYCEFVARKLRPFCDGPLLFQPINELSVMAWAASSKSLIPTGTSALAARSRALKRQLVRAALRGSEAIWAVEPSARIVHTDPTVHIVPPAGAPPEMVEEASRQRDFQLPAWDMISGRLEPELGGSPKHLDILGLSYGAPQGIGEAWHGIKEGPRFSDMAAEMWRRYERPMLIAETSLIGYGNEAKADGIAAEILECDRRGIPLEGICLHPVIEERLDMHDKTAPQTEATETKETDEPAFRPLPGLRIHQLTSAIENEETTISALIVFSPLRWDSIFRRPRHLLPHLAGRYLILFVEEPMMAKGEDFLELLTPHANIEVLRPHLAGAMHGFDNLHAAALRDLLGRYLAERHIQHYWLWFYTPLALPVAQELAPQGIIYDCLDEVSALRPGTTQLAERELLARANLVFTGSPSLYQSKRRLHDNVHCFMNSVDAAYFTTAPGHIREDHPMQRRLPHPRLGYCGAIDKRIDLGLVAMLADAHPEWQIVMAGPLIGIDPLLLPRRSNLHWLGPCSYDEQPQLLAGWDLCLLPFALNESARCISPAVTLEYMAAERPIVSTRIRDIVETYGHTVAIARNHAEFVDDCAYLLTEPERLRRIRRQAMREIVATTSWGKTAEAMQRLIDQLTPGTRAALPALPHHAAIGQAANY